MVTTNYGKGELALAIVGSLSEFPQYCGIGSGSGTVTVDRSGLYDEISSRKIWTSRDTSTARQVDFTFDFSSVVMSGINLREFMIGGSAAIDSGDAWNVENFNAVNFDGTIEAQIEVIYEIF